MKLREFYNYLSGLYPQSLSAEWDNDGIMCAVRQDADVSKVLVSLDADIGAINYAAENSYDTLLTHHPMIFHGVKRICQGDAVSERIITTVNNGISVLSFHTRLDAADGGVNDALAKTLGFERCEKFGDDETPSLGRIGVLDKYVAFTEFACMVKNALGCDSVRAVGDGQIRRVAMVGGDGKDFIVPAMKCGADVLVTGDAGYNAAQDAAEAGFCVVEAGHYHTEAPVCGFLTETVRKLGITADIYNSCAYTVI